MERPGRKKIGFMEVACQNYEVLVEDKWAGKSGGVKLSNRYDTRSAQKKSDGGPTGPWDGTKLTSFRLSSEIERVMDLRKFFEEWILVGENADEGEDLGEDLINDDPVRDA